MFAELVEHLGDAAEVGTHARFFVPAVLDQLDQPIIDFFVTNVPHDQRPIRRRMVDADLLENFCHIIYIHGDSQVAVPYQVN